MSENNQKKLYLIIIISILFSFFSVSIFFFIFGTYENSNLDYRIQFLFINLILYALVLFITILISNEVYND